MSEENINDSELYEVESILSDRMKKGKKQYKIKWLGYPVSESTWEDVENLFCSEMIEQYNKAKETTNKVKNMSKRRFSEKTPSMTSEKNNVETNEILSILGVFKADDGTIIVEYKTRDNKSMACPASEFHHKSPILLLEYYERYLEFEE